MPKMEKVVRRLQDLKIIDRLIEPRDSSSKINDKNS